MHKRLALSIVLIMASFTYALEDVCKKGIQTDQAYIIGYGSLMNKVSLSRSLPGHSELIPVEVSGFKRSLDLVADIVGLKTIFLAVHEDSGAKINAALIKVSANELQELDKREQGYCRQYVEPQALKLLVNKAYDKHLPAYIYTHSQESLSTKHETVEAAVVQSYIDVFLSGCIALEKDYSLKDFAKQCVSTTTGWADVALINDRVFPRRPWVYQPKAMRIDQLLLDYNPKIIVNRRFEYDKSPESSS